MKQLGGTGIIGQDMVCGFGNGKYTQFEGTEIVAENCVKAKVKDLVVEGKTYQNLLKQANEYNFSTDVTVSNNIIEYDGSNPIVINSNLIKSDTVYTLYFNVLALPTEKVNYPIRINSKGNKYDLNLGGNGNKLGINKIVFNSGSDISKLNICLYLTNYHIGFKCTMPILLEGDYTHIDLPNSINGIESVTEKEENLLSAKINDNTTTLNLPSPLRSLPNGTCDTIEGNKLVQRVGKVVLDGSESNISIENQTEDYTRVFMNTVLNKKAVAPSVGFCNELLYEAIHKNTYEHIYATGYSVWVFIKTANLTSNNIDGVKTYLKNNPVTIYYELAEPIIHDLEIPSISTTKRTNTITTTNNIKPNMTMKVKVKK